MVGNCVSTLDSRSATTVENCAVGEQLMDAFSLDRVTGIDRILVPEHADWPWSWLADAAQAGREAVPIFQAM